MTTTILHPSARDTGSRGRRPAAVAVAASAGSIVAITVAGLLDPGYSALSEGISALASTESQSAPIMIIGFGLMAATAVRDRCGRVAGTGRQARGGSRHPARPGGRGHRRPTGGFFRRARSSLQQVCLQRESDGTVSSEHVLHNLIALPLFLFLVIAGFLLVGAAGRSPALRPVPRWGSGRCDQHVDLLRLVRFRRFTPMWAAWCNGCWCCRPTRCR